MLLLPHAQVAHLINTSTNAARSAARMVLVWMGSAATHFSPVYPFSACFLSDCGLRPLVSYNRQFMPIIHNRCCTQLPSVLQRGACAAEHPAYPIDSVGISSCSLFPPFHLLIENSRWGRGRGLGFGDGVREDVVGGGCSGEGNLPSPFPGERLTNWVLFATPTTFGGQILITPCW